MVSVDVMMAHFVHEGHSRYHIDEAGNGVGVGDGIFRGTYTVFVNNKPVEKTVI
jgi:hypothetical protein